MANPPEGMISPAGSPPPPAVDPREAVKMPALLMMVAAGIGAMSCVLFILLNILGTGIGALVSESGEEHAFNFMSGGFAIFVEFVGILVAGFIVFGALMMKDLKNYNLALLASIASLIPCVSPCCLVTVPFGIWALVVLNKPEVKAAFAKK